MKYTYLIALATASTVLLSCSDTKENVAPTETTSTNLEKFYTGEAPEGARHISEIFADPTPGREIVVSGEIMGRSEPFIDGRAMVVLGDPTKITPCNRIPGDLCPTPWDNCCDDPDVLKKSVATIQFLDEEGKVLKTGLKGFKGIKELSYLTIKGEIAEGSNPNNLLISADSFHITDPSPYLNAKAVSGGLDGEVTVEGDVFIYTKKKADE